MIFFGALSTDIFIFLPLWSKSIYVYFNKCDFLLWLSWCLCRKIAFVLEFCVQYVYFCWHFLFIHEWKSSCFRKKKMEMGTFTHTGDAHFHPQSWSLRTKVCWRLFLTDTAVQQTDPGWTKTAIIEKLQKQRSISFKHIIFS